MSMVSFPVTGASERMTTDEQRCCQATRTGSILQSGNELQQFMAIGTSLPSGPIPGNGS